MKIKQEQKNALGYCFTIALFEESVLLVQSRKLLAAVIPFPVSPPPSTTACSLWRAQSRVPSPLLRGKGTFLNQLQCLGNGPIAPAGGPVAPPMPLHIPITCPYRKTPPYLILSCTTSSEKMGKWSAVTGNSKGFLELLIQIPFPLPLLPSVAINAYDAWATVFSQILAAGRQHTLLNDSSKN